MKKTLKIAAVSLVACMLATAASAFAPVGDVNVPYATPTMDGVISAGEYPGDKLVINEANATAGGWLGQVPAENSIEVYFAWDDTNFYIAGNITDPEFSTSMENVLQGDLFQLSLNVNNIFETQDAASRAIFYSWGLQDDDGTVDIIRAESGNDATIEELGLGTVTDTGWTFEVALSLEMLAEDASFKSGTDVTIGAGSNIGGLICYLDRDFLYNIINAYGTCATETVGWDPAAHGINFILVGNPAEEAVSAEAANGVIEATEGNAGETADMLFDGDENTKWCLAGSDAYVIWKTDAVTATGYEIVTANDNASYPGRNPTVWTLSGSADGENWTVIDAVEGDTVLQDVNFTPFTFAIDAPAEYAYYKLEVSGFTSGTLQISGINLLTGDVVASAPAAEEVVEEVVEAPVETVEETVTEAPQTFDAGIIAAVAAIISVAGYALSKKR